MTHLDNTKRNNHYTLHNFLEQHDTEELKDNICFYCEQWQICPYFLTSSYQCQKKQGKKIVDRIEEKFPEVKQ